MMRNRIIEHSIKLSQRWLGVAHTRGRQHQHGNVLYRPQTLFLSAFGERQKMKVGYEGLPKKVSGYFGRGLLSMRDRPCAYSDTPAVGLTTAPYPPSSAAHYCQGISLVEVLMALTLLSISSLLILHYMGSLQRSEQTLWQRREVWQQLAQKLEGSEQPSQPIEEQRIAAMNGCYWQQVTWQAADLSPQSLQRLRCP